MKHVYYKTIEGAREESEMEKTGRKVRENLTAEEKERLEKFGSVSFQSAGATRNK